MLTSRHSVFAIWVIMLMSMTSSASPVETALFNTASGKNAASTIGAMTTSANVTSTNTITVSGKATATIAGTAAMISSTITKNLTVPSAATNLKFAGAFPERYNITEIEARAQGTLPAVRYPKHLTEDAVTAFQLIAFAELLEVAFLWGLLDKIQTDADGFVVAKGISKDILVETLETAAAQEQLYFLTANAILRNAGAQIIGPCQYKFTPSNLTEALELASTTTNVALGTLQDTLESLGTSGDAAFLPLIGSIIGQKGEQNTLYWSLAQSSKIGDFKPPSQVPFPTRSTERILYNYLNQTFVQPGSCIGIERTNLARIANLAELVRLNSFGFSEGNLTGPSINATQNKSEQMIFRIEPPNMKEFYKSWNSSKSTLSAAYINQQSQPFIRRVDGLVNISLSNATGVTLSYQQDALDLKGTTIILLVNSAEQGDSTIEHVMKTAQYGPFIVSGSQ